jgi:DNA-3-methyladenine glycosylase II
VARNHGKYLQTGAFPLTFTLDLDTLLEGSRILAGQDSHLAWVLETIGPPPLWSRDPVFGTLIYIILEQQVSLASAKAAYLRLEAALSTITPQGFLTLDDAELRAIGFSRQKTGYGRILAQAVLDGSLDLVALHGMEDDAVRAELMKLKGIGRWTADIYLMEALLRPDIWPSGDLALAIAVQRVKGTPTVLRPPELEMLGENYRPWRSVAARLFWHHYLSGTNQKPPYMPET